MRIAIFSDVHANIEALSAVVESIRQDGAERVVCLGDVVGYGASPNECCALVREVAEETLLGNHDAAVAGRMDFSYYYDAARDALNWHASILEPTHMEWLRARPYTYDLPEAGVGFCHGSPLNPPQYDYIFSCDQAELLAPRKEALPFVTFIGHSHLCKVFGLDEAGHAIDLPGSTATLDEGRRYIISVGSVGQPRDYDHRACYTAYDTETRRFEFRRTPYAVEQTALKIFDADLALNFGKRLFFGV
jgi:diadenosine tetraphosphatase ApaH/serine/threonine PP2A family protein phosphatase